MSSSKIKSTWLGSKENVDRFSPLLGEARELRERILTNNPPKYIAGDFNVYKDPRFEGSTKNPPVYSRIELIELPERKYMLKRDVPSNSYIYEQAYIDREGNHLNKDRDESRLVFADSNELVITLLQLFREELIAVEHFRQSKMPDVIVKGPSTYGESLPLQDGAVLETLASKITKSQLGISAPMPIRWNGESIEFGACTWSPKQIQTEFKNCIWSFTNKNIGTRNGYWVPKVENYHSIRHGGQLVGTYIFPQIYKNNVIPNGAHSPLITLQDTMANLFSSVIQRNNEQNAIDEEFEWADQEKLKTTKAETSRLIITAEEALKTLQALNIPELSKMITDIRLMIDKLSVE